METISSGGKEYVKATVLARELGYTTDYIGQLARAKKIDATLVGRSWFVEPESVKSHKQSRYRSTAEKSKEAIRHEITKRKESGTIIITKGATSSPKETAQKHFYKKAPETVLYEEDVSELIPTLTRESNDKQVYKRLSVEPAGAVKLSVDSQGEKYVGNATDLPNLTLQGTLTVEDADPDPKKVHVRSAGRARKISLNKAKKLAKQKPATFSDRLLQGGSKPQLPQTRPRTRIRVKQPHAVQTPVSHLLVATLASATLALIAATVVVGTEQSLTFADETSNTTYIFSLKAVIESIKNLYL